MKKPIIPWIISCKKMNKQALSRHHNYRYIKEYEYSPSKIQPLMSYYRKPTKRKSYGNLFSMVFVGKYLGMINRRRERGKYSIPQSIRNGLVVEESVEARGDLNGGDECIDVKAEVFIKKFYEDIRMQCPGSISHLKRI